MKLNNFVEGIKKTSKKIDISNWKEYPLRDLFDIMLSKGDNQAKKLNDGEVPLISAGNFNNGICKYIDKGDGQSEIFKKNKITIDMFGKSFYQDKDFYAVSHGRINILNPKFNLNKNIGLFLIGVFDVTFRKKYSFSTMCSQSALNKESVMLPTKNNNPDWKYMENYIQKNSLNYSKIDFKNLNEIYKKIKDETKIIKTNWKEFKLCGKNGIFELKNSISKIHNKNIIGTKGNIPYVTRTDKNNGISKYIEKQKIKVNRGNCLTLGMDVGTIFYQENEFYTGDKIKILRNQNLNKINSLFLIAILKKSFKQNFSWGGKGMNFKELPKLEINLPVDKNGNPDWKFMEDYIKSLPYSKSLEN